MQYPSVVHVYIKLFLVVNWHSTYCNGGHPQLLHQPRFTCSCKYRSCIPIAYPVQLRGQYAIFGIYACTFAAVIYISYNTHTSKNYELCMWRCKFCEKLHLIYTCVFLCVFQYTYTAPISVECVNTSDEGSSHTIVWFAPSCWSHRHRAVATGHWWHPSCHQMDWRLEFLPGHPNTCHDVVMDIRDSSAAEKTLPARWCQLLKNAPYPVLQWLAWAGLR